MVLAGRPSTGDGGRQRWLVLGLVITAIVLLIDASIKTADPARARQLSAQAWLDRSLVIVGQSNVQAAELNGFRTATTTDLTAAEVTGELSAMTTGAQTSYRELEALRAPAALAPAADLLQACLLVRAEAAATVSSVVEASLGGPRAPAARTATAPQTGTAAHRLTAAVGQLQLADQAYRLFATHLPASVGMTVPPSTWVTSAGLYTTGSLQVFLDALRSRVSLAPVHSVSIVSVATTPTPLGTTGPRQSIEILLPSTALAVTAVVGNLGNQDETGLTLTATISPATGTPTVSRRFDLAAGATTAVTLAPLTPRLGRTVTLTISVGAAAGSPTAAVSRTIRFVMPAPTSSSTTSAPTTSTLAPTSTSVAG